MQIDLAQQWRDLFNPMPLGAHFYRLESDERLVFAGANPAADRILKVDSSQFVGLTIEEAFPSLAPTAIPDAYRQVIRTGRPWSDEQVLYQDRQIVGAYSVHAVATGRSTMVALFEEITERRRAEQERQTVQAAVQQTQKRESLGVIAGGMAHDFNNLLCGMLGSAELAMVQLLPFHPAREDLRHISETAQRAAVLCKQLLAYSGKGRFVMRPTHLSRLIEEMNPLLTMSVYQGTKLHYQLASDLPMVEADPTQLRQIVLNLISNASEAIGDRSGVITVTTGTAYCDHHVLASPWLNETPPPGHYVSLEVSDNGCGMSEEIRSLIFDPFFSTKFTGRGLGLAAVLGIIRGHRGTIQVDSQVGHGSTFQIRLPACETPTQTSLESATPARGKGSGAYMLVDDEPAVCTTVQRLL